MGRIELPTLRELQSPTLPTELHIHLLNLVANVGNDPTSRDFQSPANPSQLICH